MGGAMSDACGGAIAAPRSESAAIQPVLRRPRVAVAAVLLAMVLVVIDAAMASVALPTLGQALEASPAMSVLVVTTYQLALVMSLLPCAALGESLGHRRVFTAGVMLFIAAAALCSLSSSLPLLLAGRFLQGLGAAALMALGVALLRQVVAADRLGAAIGWNSLAVALASAAGPAVGAVVLSSLSWRWLFVAEFPLGAVVLLASRALPAAAGTGRRVDGISAALHAGSFCAFAVGVGWLPDQPATAAGLLCIAAVGMAALLRRETASPMPMVPLDLLRSASFRIAVVASVLCFAGQTAAMIALPFYLQHVQHLGASITGLLIMPWPLAVALTAPVAGRLADRLPGALLCAVGGLALATGLDLLAIWPDSDGPWCVAPLIALCGVGFGLFQIANNREMYLSAPATRSGAAGGLQGTARLTGQMLGSLATTLLFALGVVAPSSRLAMAVGAGLTLAAGLVSLLRLPTRPAFR